MPGLVIWTTANTSTARNVFAPTFANFKPHIPEHSFLQYAGDGSAVAMPKNGDVVLVCGKRPMEALQAAGLAPKNRTITSMRGKMVASGAGGHYMFTFDPQTVSSEPSNRELIDWDVRLAVRYLRTGKLEPTMGDLRWVNDYGPMIKRIEDEYAKTGKPVKVSTDTETMTFYPWYPENDIVSVSFSDRPGTAEVLYTYQGQEPPIPYNPEVDLYSQIEWLLTSPKISLRLANGKYDMIWFAEKWGIECTNFRFDSMLVGTLLDENRSNSLNLHAKLFTDFGGYDDEFNDTVDKGHMERLKPDGKYLTYAGGDTDACLQSSEVLQQQLVEQPGLLNFYVNILHPAARAFEKIERRGVCVDVNKMHVLKDDLEAVIGENTKKMVDILPFKLKCKYKDKIESQLENGKNPLTPAILKDFFFGASGLHLQPKIKTAKTGEPSTAKAHLRMFGDVPEAAAMVEILSENDSAAKTLSTFVVGFLKHLRPDGRLHPTYMLFHGGLNDDEDDESGSTTGRLSAKDPAFQTIPKKTKWAKRLRECYPAPKGKIILSRDYSQGELKVVACIAPEKTMLQSYMNGLDLHAVTGAQLAQVPLEEFLSWKDHTDTALANLFDLNRSKAKPANFGLLYGMSAEGFQAYAWSNYGLKLTLEEAETMRNAFFELYPGLIAYHERMRTIVRATKQVVSPLGRIRHLPHIDAWDRKVKSSAERQAINSPVQSTLTDMMIWACAIMEAELGDDLALVGTIHDAFVAYPDADPAKLDSIISDTRMIMESLPFEKTFGWKPQLPFTSDAEAGYDMAHMNKVKLAA